MTRLSKLINQSLLVSNSFGWKVSQRFLGSSRGLEIVKKTDCKDGRDDTTSMKVKMEKFIKQTQRNMIDALEAEDPSHKFVPDDWTKEGSKGTTCNLNNGAVYEKANIDASVYHGILPPPAVAIMKGKGKKIQECEETPFWACGVSGIIHPRNPHVPTFHFNLRYFELEELLGEKSWWFGGVCDLNPYYLDEGDCSYFHQTLKAACDKHDPKYYPHYKAWCDQYFRIKHRGFNRGIGGIFFDDLDNPDQDTAFKFIETCATAFPTSYLPIVQKNKMKEYGLAEKQWQFIKRGHYAEFNLTIDRGTRFGLETPMANIESVMCSLPPRAGWEYNYSPSAGSREEQLSKVLETPREWV